MAAREDLPRGTVTFLFTDVEGSTSLLHRLGEAAYANALTEHRRVIRDAISKHGGVEVDTQGDAFFIAFSTAADAIAAAEAIVDGLHGSDIRVRAGLHTGSPLTTDEGYVGVDVHRAARIAACGHGGQVLVSAATALLAGSDGMTDLGDHRLKDLSAPERLYQLGSERFPPLRSLYKTNLPVPATPFVGRDAEVAELAAAIADGESRLVTVVGPGGIGKTRLALQAAALASESFPDGVYWVPLAPLTDAKLVLPKVAEALAAPGDAAATIGDRSMLLLLDNLEQVIDAAGDIQDLLLACRRLHVVVTSRQLLRVPSERAHDVVSLERTDAEELFVGRARAADPTFTTSPAVRELCDRLEDIPLALELAAARMRVLTPEQLIGRLGERLDLLKAGRASHDRQRTLRATIEWSHDLLDAEEKSLFARVAVFAGGWTLDAAEEIVDADLDTLESLVDKSLVRVRDGGRFWMLETIRAFADEHLAALPEESDVRRRHAEFFLAAARSIAPGLMGGERPALLRRLNADRDNFRRAVLSFDREELQRFLRAVGPFWVPVFEVRGWLDRALSGEPEHTEAYAGALLAAAQITSNTGDAKTGADYARKALALYSALGDPVGAAYTQWTLGYSLAETGAVDEAHELMSESVRGLAAAGEDNALAWATRSLAFITIGRGDLARGRALHEENLQRTRALGHRPAEATTLGALAMLALGEERIDDALELLSENLSILVELDEPASVPTNLVRVAAALTLARRAEPAATILAHAVVSLDELGIRPVWLDGTISEVEDLLAEQLDADRLRAANGRGAAISRTDALALARDELAAALAS